MISYTIDYMAGISTQRLVLQQRGSKFSEIHSTHNNRLADRQIDRQAGRQAARQTGDRQTNRQAGKVMLH